MAIIDYLRNAFKSEEENQPVILNKIPDVNDVIRVIEEEVSFSPYVLRENITYETTESRVQRSLSEQLKKVYGKDIVDTEYHIGGHKGMRCDLDIANGTVGIELKMAKQLRSAANLERLVGQVVYDCWIRYRSGNFVVVVVGNEKENDAPIKELASIIRSLGAQFIYKTVAKKESGN